MLYSVSWVPTPPPVLVVPWPARATPPKPSPAAPTSPGTATSYIGFGIVNVGATCESSVGALDPWEARQHRQLTMSSRHTTAAPITMKIHSMLARLLPPLSSPRRIVAGAAVTGAVGAAVGGRVGVSVGVAVGRAVGSTVGTEVGAAVGVAVGKAVGVAVGAAVGAAVGGTDWGVGA